MRIFRRRDEGPGPPIGLEAQEPPEPEIRVSRTLVKSEPELADLVASDERLRADPIRVELAEKGFGTRVALSAPTSSGLGEADLERLLDELAEPQRRPFSAI